MISNAVGSEVVSKVTGYLLTKGFFQNTTPNLPMRLGIIGVPNQPNQAGLTDGQPYEITTLQQCGELFGYGSQIYMAMRIMRPNSGTGLGGIPTIVYPQIPNSFNESEREISVTVGGSGATGNATHTVIVGGRRIIDGVSFDFQVETGDEGDDIAIKIADAMNNVLGNPFNATPSTNIVTGSTKWTGEAANDITLTIDDNGNDVGVTYGYSQITIATGVPSLTNALNSFGNEWNTIVINTYGTNTTIMTALEQFNGIPDPSNPTGRYSPTIFKPFIALTGSTADDPSSITDTRLIDVTIAICPAPLSPAHPLEAAANMAVLFARTSQDTPHLDVSGQSYPDMPVPTTGNIGAMAQFVNRDAIVKKGCSTVHLKNGVYEVVDFVTTYHPIGETPPQYRYCRNLLGIDWNVRFGYLLLEEVNVNDHVIAEDDAIVTASKVIKPKRWKAILGGYAEDLEKRALIADKAFLTDNLIVGLSATNPDRLETFFRYERTGVARIKATTSEAGFNFGEI